MFVLASIGILALLIVVHETGHFLAAKWQDIHVNRFSLGFGPALWKLQGSETEYAVRALPLGGFVGFPDDEEECPYPPDDPDLLRNRPVLDRLVVMAAGVLANLIFAYLVLVMMCGTVGIPGAGSFESGIFVPQVLPSSPAQEAGLRPGDIVIEAGSRSFQGVTSLAEAESAIEAFQSVIQASEGKPIHLEVERLGKEQVLDLTVIPRPREEDGTPAIGITLAPNQRDNYRPARGIGDILSSAASEYQRIFRLNVESLKQLVQNFESTANQVSGPVGIVKIGAELAESSSVSLFNFTALISINLAILNLLPLPALDGGHILFLLLEAVRGRKLPNQIEERVMQTGLVLLLGLGVVLILKDTLAIVTGVG